MDNLTHSLTGWALGQAGLKTKSRKGLAALILGANAPDIDVFFGWFPWEPFATHRGFTHSLVGGVVILPLMLWGLLLLLDRWQVSRGASFKSGLAMRPGWLLALCYIGAITHPLLDLQTTYSVQLFSPFTGLWFHADSLFIIDLWLWLLLGGTIWWSKRREKREDAGYRFPVQAALAAGFIYICLNIGFSDAAKAAVRARDPQAASIFASPPPMLFWQRGMTWRNGPLIRRAEWRPFSPLGPEEPPVADNMDDPIVRLALAEDHSLRKFLHWSIMPVALVERSGCEAKVIIADARYGLPREGRARLYEETTLNLCDGARAAP